MVTRQRREKESQREREGANFYQEETTNFETLRFKKDLDLFSCFFFLNKKGLGQLA